MCETRTEQLSTKPHVVEPKVSEDVSRTRRLPDFRPPDFPFPLPVPESPEPSPEQRCSINSAPSKNEVMDDSHLKSNSQFAYTLRAEDGRIQQAFQAEHEFTSDFKLPDSDCAETGTDTNLSARSIFCSYSSTDNDSDADMVGSNAVHGRAAMHSKRKPGCIEEDELDKTLPVFGDSAAAIVVLVPPPAMVPPTQLLSSAASQHRNNSQPAVHRRSASQLETPDVRVPCPRPDAGARAKLSYVTHAQPLTAVDIGTVWLPRPTPRKQCTDLSKQNNLAVPTLHCGDRHTWLEVQ